MIDGWRHWVDGLGYRVFKCYKVYYAYRWHIAEQIDKRSLTTEIKTKYGSKIEPTFYIKTYIK